MGLSISGAYDQIKNLENSQLLTLPEPQEVITVGTVDVDTGTFTYSVPTLTQTIRLPQSSDGSGDSPSGGPPSDPEGSGPAGSTPTIGQPTSSSQSPDGLPRPPLEVTVGLVSTKAVDLLLRVAIQHTGSSAPTGEAHGHFHSGVTGSGVNIGGFSAGSGTAVATSEDGTSGISIEGFPIVSSSPSEVVVRAGLVCSTVIDSQTIAPPVSAFPFKIDIPGKPSIEPRLFILRPPVVGMGAFTIPALPITIVYAPPQGKQAKNTSTYSDTETFTHTVTSAITSSTNVKVVQAYSVSDLIGKVAGAIAAVVAVVGTGGTAAAGASVAGALTEFLTALTGASPTQPEDTVAETAAAASQVSKELSLVSNILGGIDSPPDQDGQTVTIENDHSLTLSISTMSQYGSAAGLGPGLGDRIVYLRNVKVIWAAVNGEVGINILGFDGIAAYAVRDLLEDQQAITNGGTSVTGLDANTIASLLNLDPLVSTKQNSLATGVSTAVRPKIGPPRFVPAKPPGHMGASSSSTGDPVTVTFDTTTEDKQVTTTSETTITDAKPGWLSVVFGASDQETITTSTWTSSVVSDTKSEDKLTVTVTFYSQDLDDNYDVQFLFDRTFGTYLVVDTNSPLLIGGAGFAP